MTLVLAVFEVVTHVLTFATVGFVWVTFDCDTAIGTRRAMTLDVPAPIFVALARSGLDAGGGWKAGAADLLGSAGLRAHR